MAPDPHGRGQDAMRRAFRYGADAQRLELGFARPAVALLLPIAAYFYSPRLAAALALPCAVTAGWYLRRAIRQFLKREP